VNAPRKAVHDEGERAPVAQPSGNWIRAGVIGVLLVLIAVFAVSKIHEAGPGTVAQENRSTSAQDSLPSGASAATSAATSLAGSSPDRSGEAPLESDREADAGNALVPSAQLPKLLDLGAKTCIPCKMMAPILDELRTAYAGDFDVVFTTSGRTASPRYAMAYRLSPRRSSSTRRAANCAATWGSSQGKRSSPLGKS